MKEVIYEKEKDLFNAACRVHDAFYDGLREIVRG